MYNNELVTFPEGLLREARSVNRTHDAVVQQRKCMQQSAFSTFVESVHNYSKSRSQQLKVADMQELNCHISRRSVKIIWNVSDHSTQLFKHVIYIYI